MAARSTLLILTGGILLGVAVVGAGIVVRKQPGTDAPAPLPAVHASAPAALTIQPSGPSSSEVAVVADREAAVPKAGVGRSEYDTALLKSSATGRHWRVDPREVRALTELRDAAFAGLVLTPNFGGGLRVEHPASHRLGLLRDLEQGDVVRQINGTEIQDETQFRLLAAGGWKKTGALRAAVDRAGSSLTITYRQTGAPPPPATFR